MKDMAKVETVTEEQLPTNFTFNPNLQGKLMIFVNKLRYSEVQLSVKESYFELKTVDGVFKLTKDN